MGDCKDTTNKPPLELLPKNALEGVAFIMEYGAKKYAPDSWQGVPTEKFLGAALRHIYAHLSGSLHDEESKFPHMYHAACNLIFALSIEMTKARVKND